MIEVILCIIGGILILYGLLIFILEDIQIFRILWFVLGAGLFLPKLLKGYPVPVFLYVIGAVLYLALFSGMVFIHLKNKAYAKESETVQNDVIILLGCKTPSLTMQFRSEAALNYLKKHDVPMIITTGGQGADETETEASAFRDILVSHGVQEERIVLEDTSVSTVENLEKSDQLYHVKERHVGIVTSGFHIYRSILVAKKLGYRYLSGIPGKVIPIYLPDYLLREALAFIKGMIRQTI